MAPQQEFGEDGKWLLGPDNDSTAAAALAAAAAAQATADAAAPKANPTFTGVVKAAAAGYQAGDHNLVMGADGSIRLSAIDPGS